MRVLLVEPDYYTKFPPLGLLKLSSYHKNKGDAVVGLVKGKAEIRESPDRIYITSLFTWAWQPVHEAVYYYKKYYPNAEVWLGGLYASLIPEHAILCNPDKLFQGIFWEAEDLRPDYELLEEYMPKWNGSIVFSSRGCNNNCRFCAVPRLEGKVNSAKESIIHLIYPKYSRIIFWDNNILQSPTRDKIFDELENLNLKIDFNQGIDASLITEEIAERLGRLNLDSGGGVKVRLAYDYSAKGPAVEKAIKLLNTAGIKGRRIMVYTLFNFSDDPENFLARVKDILHWGAVCYPMRYEPNCALEKNKYVSPMWDAKRIDMVQKARRVIGYMGSLPPYQGLIDKFDSASGFDEAFELRPLEESKCVAQSVV